MSSLVPGVAPESTTHGDAVVAAGHNEVHAVVSPFPKYKYTTKITAIFEGIANQLSTPGKSTYTTHCWNLGS
jgi:hypothetical protein